MSIGIVLLYILAVILAVGGIILTVFSFPGVWLVYLSTIIVAAIGNFQVITPLILVVLFFISLLSTFADELAAALGTKKAGGSKYGSIGTIIGSTIGGLVANIYGVFIGAFLGATISEYIFARKDFNESIKLGFASLIGFLIGTALKIAVEIGMVVFVLIKVL